MELNVFREHNGDTEGSIGGECSGGKGSRDGGGEEIMATGQRSGMPVSYRQGSANNDDPAGSPR